MKNAPYQGHELTCCPPIESLEARRLFAVVGEIYTVPENPRQITPLNGDWKFSLDAGGSAQGIAVNDSGWQSVNLPHTWNGFDAQDGGSNYRRGIGWYRKTITAPVDTAGDRYQLQFNGASLVTKVYIDGQPVGQHAGAFGGFSFDVTSALADGLPHVLAIACDNTANYTKTVAPSDGADFNVNGGLYQDVSLVAVEPQHVALDNSGSSGVFFTTPSLDALQAAIQVKTDLANDGDARNLLVDSILVDQSGTVISDTVTTQLLDAGTSADVTQSSTVDNPHLWNGVKDPYLNDLYVEVRDADTGELLDLVHQRVGFRSFQIDPNQGFILNGQPYDLHGGMYQLDRRNKGWAISGDDIRADIAVIKNLGATVVRTHYQLPALFGDLADEAGLVVLNEVPFNGSGNRAMTVFADDFLANYKQQMQALVLQNYNRPSVVSWGIYNELTDNQANRDLVAAMVAFTHSIDPARVTTGASWTDRIGAMEPLTDVIAYNEYKGWFNGLVTDLGPLLDTLHAAAPNLPIGVSEFGAGGNPAQHGNLSNVSAHGYTHSEEYQNQLYEQTWSQLASRSFLWEKTQFLLFDTANDGNTTGNSPGVSDYGLINQDRSIKKDTYFYLKANWSADPVLYLTSRRWTNRTAAVTDIKVYANVEVPQLYVNGVLVGAMQSIGNAVYSVPTYTLAAGKNVITVTGTRDGQTYTDTATWTYGSSSGGGGTSVPTPTPVEGQQIFQAENATLSGGTVRAANHSGYTADGFADYSGNASAVQWTLSWPAAGQAKLDFRYANGATASRPLTVYVNGVSVGSVACAPTGSWQTWKTVSLTVSLKTGSNTIKAVAGSVGGANVDSLTITPTSIAPPPPPPASTGSISGFVFDDSDNDGAFDETETKPSGRTVFLDANNNGKFDSGEASTTTDDVGAFSFANLAADTYRVRQVLPSSTAYSTPLADVALASGQVFGSVVIGTKVSTTPPPPPPAPTGTISGYTFNDSDKDGVLDKTESKASGKTVFLDTNNNGKLDSGEKSLVTDSSGAFSFGGLIAGTYSVRRLFPSGYSYSTPLRNLNLAAGQVLGGVTIGSKTL